MDKMRAEAVARYGMAGWEIYKDEEDGREIHIADVWPILLGRLTRTHRPWAESFQLGIAIWPVVEMDAFVESMTDTRTFDWAVPIGLDGRYPHGGAAITIYDSDMLPHGVIALASVRVAVMNSAARLVARACGVESLAVTSC